MNKLKRRQWLPLIMLAGLFVTAPGYCANINIINLDGANEGLNDPAPRQPVGGNPGTTLGAQRLNVLNYAAALLGDRVVSSVDIQVGAQFDPDTCGSSNANLGAAGANTLIADFKGAPLDNTFYPVALANALSGSDQDSGRDIDATFNSRLDEGGNCLGGNNWYYGLDNKPGNNQIDFLATAVHELIHGLGFASFADLPTGEYAPDNAGKPVPDIYSSLIFDLTRQRAWTQLSARQRRASATNSNNGGLLGGGDGSSNVVWNGRNQSLEAGSISQGARSGRVQLYAPNPLENGSSISHWNTTVTPNALMEPFATGGIDVLHGIGLAACLLSDIGWQLAAGISCPDNNSSPPPLSAVNGNSGTNGGGSTSNNGGGNTSGGGGGGGCALAGGVTDPLLPLLVLLSLMVLYRRRTMSAG